MIPAVRLAVQHKQAMATLVLYRERITSLEAALRKAKIEAERASALLDKYLGEDTVKIGRRITTL